MNDDSIIFMGENFSPKPYEFAAAAPFSATDATLSDQLNALAVTNKDTYSVRRIELSTGSANYEIRLKRNGRSDYIGSIVIRSFDTNITYIAYQTALGKQLDKLVTYRHLLHENEKSEVDRYDALESEYQKFFLALISMAIRVINDRKEMGRKLLLEQQSLNLSDTSPSETFLPEFIVSHRPGRRESWAEDNWAWEQVNILGKARDEVRREWEQRLSSERGTLNDPRRSFRHAVDPKRKVQRKAEE